MPPLINVQKISKAFGANPLFQNISFTVSEGDRIGLIGPNGSGKSTLLRMLAGEVEPDEGEIAVRKRLRLSLRRAGLGLRGRTQRCDRWSRVRWCGRRCRSRSVARALPRLWAAPASKTLKPRATSLSGGWQKRLAIVEALVQAPGHSSAGRTHESSRPGGNRVAGRTSGAGRLRLCGDQPRPLFSGECRHRDGGTEPRVSRRAAARARKLHHISGEERRISARAIEAPGSAGESGSLGNRMAAPRSKSAHQKIEGAHRQGRRTDGRTCRPECENPNFAAHRSISPPPIERPSA